MDIILNTTFNNPNLPIVQRPGFTDDFNRPAGVGLGTTIDGKPWDYLGLNAWSITGDGTATGDGGSNFAAVDALRSDGTLTARIAKAATSADLRAGLLFRAVDRQNYLYLCPNTSNVLTLYARVDNEITLSRAISGHTLETGDAVSVKMEGPTITISRNGAVVHTEAVTALMGATSHGFYSSASSDTEFDSVSFATN